MESVLVKCIGGDGMIKQGHYIGFLATEYALRKRYGLDVTGILNELYFALKAINRVDRFAESDLGFDVYNYNFPENLNGFYLREDIPEDFCEIFSDNDEDFQCTNSAYYKNNNAAKINDGANLQQTDNSYQNVRSLDQLTSLMVGFSVVHKLNTFHFNKSFFHYKFRNLYGVGRGPFS